MIGRNYIDVKTTVWERFHFEDDMDMNKIIDILKTALIGIEPIELLVDEELLFQESETLAETSVYMTVEENSGYSTIEVYTKDNTESIWDNGKIK